MSNKQAQQVFYTAYGLGPWPCHFCDEVVVDMTTHYGCIHHIDEDPRHNVPENLVPAHHTCHSRHHRTNVKDSDETRAKKREVALARSDELKSQLSFKGHTHSIETRERMREKAIKRCDDPDEIERRRLRMLGTTMPSETRDKISAAMKGKPKSPETRRRMVLAQQKRAAEKRTQKEKLT